MNKRALLSVALLAAATHFGISAGDVVSRSFIGTGQVEVPHPFEYRNFWQHDDVPNGKQYNFEITPIFSRSADAKGLRHYFSPFAKDELVVRERGADVVGGIDITTGDLQDILSYNFNVVTGAGVANGLFHSTLAFTPRRTTAGVELSCFLQNCEKYWVQLSTQLLHVTTDLQMKETIVTSGTASTNAGDFIIDGVTRKATMEEALKQPEMLYGKIDGSRKKTGLADIHATFGYNWKREADHYVQPFCGIVIPTGNKPKAEYLFEAIVGNNKHFGIFFGGQTGNVLHEDAHKTVLLSSKFQSTYRVQNTQKRSFDPAGKPWGRYLSVYNNNADMVAPTMRWGINHFTKDVQVKPYFTHHGDMQLHIIKGSINYHLGYAFTVQNEEELKLNETWTDPAISFFDVNGGFCQPSRQINTVNYFALPDDGNAANAQFIPVIEGELDLQSAAQPFNTQHRFYGAVSKEYHTKEDKVYHANGGFSYTASIDNRAISHWQLWAGLHSEF